MVIEALGSWGAVQIEATWGGFWVVFLWPWVKVALRETKFDWSKDQIIGTVPVLDFRTKEGKRVYNLADLGGQKGNAASQ